METAFVSAEDAFVLCNRIHELENSMYYVGIIDSLGHIMSEYFSDQLEKERSLIQVPQRVQDYYGVQAAMITNILKLGESILGESKYVISAYQRFSLLFIPIKNRNVMILVALPAAVDEKSVAQKILGIFN